MRTLLLLCALLAAQDAALESRSKPEPAPGELDFPAAPAVPSSEPFSAPAASGELDFLFPGNRISRIPPKAPEVDTSRPMLDKKELQVRALEKSKGSGFITDDGKRGFRKVSFSPNRTASASSVSISPSAAIIAALYGVGMTPTATGGPGGKGFQRMWNLPEPPGSLGAILARGQHDDPLAEQLMAENQQWKVGHTVKTKDGYTAQMVAFDGAKAYGYRHAWKITDKDGKSHHEYSSPLILDLNGDGVRMSRRAAKIDVDGDGKAEYVNEISAGDGLLVFDANKNGISGENGREAFGDATDLDGDGKRDGYLDGFEALLALADSTGYGSDDVLDASELAALEKSHGLKIKVGGVHKPAIPLSEAGVTTIWLPRTQSKTAENFDGQGNKTTRREGAVFARKDGSIGVYEDVWFEL